MSDSIKNRKTIPWLSRAMFWLGIASTLLLVYASLVPLKYTPLPWPDTFDRWHSIQWLNLGVGNRADWIANALVVIPSAFLLSGAVDYGRRSRLLLLFAAPLILATLSAVVLGIELVQVWFPPRTVSQNDIFAGWVGAAVGIGAWALFGRPMAFALEYFVSLESIPSRVQWIVGALCLASVAYTLYPLDFVIGEVELNEKIATGRIRWSLSVRDLASLEGIKGALLSFGKLAPFGLWLGLSRRRSFPWMIVPILAIGLEAAQIPIYSKFATSSDAIASIAGGWVGWVVARYYPVWCNWLNRGWIWSVASALWSLALIGFFNLRYTSLLRDDVEILARWQEFFTAPLLRYYYTSEYSAISNLAGKLGMFGALGILIAMAGWIRVGSCSAKRFWIGLIWTTGLGAIIEVMQVYLPPLVSDASDVGIYSCGYAMGYVVTSIVMGRTKHGVR